MVATNGEEAGPTAVGEDSRGEEARHLLLATRKEGAQHPLADAALHHLADAALHHRRGGHLPEKTLTRIVAKTAKRQRRRVTRNVFGAILSECKFGAANLYSA